MKPILHIVLGLLLVTACRKDPAAIVEIAAEEPFPLELPIGLPFPPLSEGNPLTRSSVELGKALFFEPRLSRDGTVSCNSCHSTSHAFSDTVTLSVGIDGQLGMRNAPTLGNVAYHPYFFRDGGVPTLEQQVIAPIQDPLEMDYHIQNAAVALSEVEPYASLSIKAYGRPLDAYVVTRAIANYERTLISGWSPFDRFMYQGELSALSTSEQNGWALFSSAELNCTGCHSGFDLTDHSFQNIGQYLEYEDPGRERITFQPLDIGKFKVPTLRNIALTAPYMHDGAMTTLDEVIDHFESGGQAHPNKSPILTTFVLTPQERTDLIAFLNALTDDRSLDQVP
ncbi:MAG: cytochrome c peroxidase [Flavobacteriales bacterium]